MQERRRGIARLALVLAVAAMVASLGAAATRSSAASRTNATVSLRKTALGTILVNAKGRSLYLFAKDKHDKSACSGACATYWPPLIVHGKPTAGAGVKAALLGTTKRSNGSLQVTYNRHPLYTFALDKKAGQVSGQGSTAFGAHWWATSARGSAIEKMPAAAGTTTSGTTTSTSPYPYP
jgi:predicted lipoprotein with Yx(FWY)xxD motif